MRHCSCGGLIRQWDVDAGERWECGACGRRETVVPLGRQTLGPPDNMSPETHAFEPKGNEGPSLGMQQPLGFCVSGADCHDETANPVRVAIERTDTLRNDRPSRGGLDRGITGGLRECDCQSAQSHESIRPTHLIPCLTEAQRERRDSPLSPGDLCLFEGHK